MSSREDFGRVLWSVVGGILGGKELGSVSGWSGVWAGSGLMLGDGGVEVDAG